MLETIDHRLNLKKLLLGTLSQEDSLAYIACLSEIAALQQDLFNLTIETVRGEIATAGSGLFTNAGTLVDCCGTGGSGLSHYNTSTTVAFVLAAAGLKVTKFGNRAASNRSGSFDLLDQLAIGAVLPLQALPEVLEKTNLAFLFAPQFYPTLATLAPLRRLFGKPTVFNYIGPLLNPASPSYRLIGVPDQAIQTLVANHLQQENKIEQAAVVNARSGLDELDVLAVNNIISIYRGGSPGGSQSDDNKNELVMHKSTIDPAHSFALTGKREGFLTAEDNRLIFTSLIDGQLAEDNYYHALVCLNAGQALQISRQVSDLAEGIKLASKLIKDGSVQAKFLQFQKHFKQ